MEFLVKTERREQIIDITDKVAQAIKDSFEKGKACLVHVSHATCAILLNNFSDQTISEDILRALRDLCPKGVWTHDNIDDNGDAHIKSIFMGASKTIPLENGELKLGTWQRIALADFDGPRERKIIVRVLQ